MQFIVVIALLWALSEALEYGAKRAGRSAKSAAVKRWNASKARRPVSRPGRVGSAVGRGLGAGTAAAFHGGKGFVAGLREGYPIGKQAAYDWHAKRQATKVTPLQDALAPEPAPHVTPATEGRPGDVIPAVKPRQRLAAARWRIDDGTGPVEVFTAQDLHARLAKAEQDGHPVRLTALDDGGPVELDPATLTPIPNDAQDVQSRPESPAATEGEHDMPLIDTVTGGEVVTYEQLIAELKSIQDEAVAELDDAQGDAQRAKEDAARVETMVASLTALNLDSESLSEINNLLEPAQQRLTAAEQRQAAAEQRAALAQTASEGVTSRHAAIMEHAGVMADRPFYG